MSTGMTAAFWVAGGVVASFLTIWVNPKLAQLSVGSAAFAIMILMGIALLWNITRRS